VCLLHSNHNARLRRVLAHAREIAPVDARDVAAVAVAVIGHSHADGRFAVTGPEALTLLEIADKLSFATGMQVGCDGGSNRRNHLRDSNAANIR